MSDPIKKSHKPRIAEDKLPEPQIELTGFSQPSMFGQLMSSGLNMISTLSGKKKAVSKAFVAKDSKSKDSTYKPTWNNEKFADPHIEHTNFTSAISEYNKQQQNPLLRRVAPPPLVIRKQKPPMPFIYKFAIFSVVVVVALGSFMYVDKKYNIRQTLQDMRDPSKHKLKIKRKPAIDE